ncbi:hypothetical protein M1116_02000 [Patescibacteria group bacterium]|nr:hypothetical protein [Patescibacteria group bacterium]
MREILRSFDNALVDFRWTWLRPLQEYSLRKKCVAEILTAAKNADIHLNSTCLSASRRPRTKTDNSAVWMLAQLKERGGDYTPTFFVDNGSQPTPADFYNWNYARIGGITNEQYPRESGDYQQIRRGIEHTIHPEFEEAYRDCQRRYQEDLAQWHHDYQAWAEKPSAYWEALARSQTHECPTCYGQGTHGTGQSGIGDVYCEECGGGGFSGPSPEKIRGSAEPSQPADCAPSIRRREEERINQELKRRGLRPPRPEFPAYVRFASGEGIK